MQIDKQNGNICFNDKCHTYFDITKPEDKYISVTTLIHSFAQDFDKNFWSAYKALEKLLPKDSWTIEKKSLLNTKKFNKKILDAYNISENDFNKTQQEILDEWDKENKKSCERGTKIHSDLENSFYKKPKNISLQMYGIGGKFECKKDNYDLDLEYGVYPEYLIYYVKDELKLAGQVDLIIKQGNEIIIADYKGLPLDTPILTSNGWFTMKDLKIGDKVFDKDGNLCNVVVKSSIHNNPCYRIHFDNSESIVADVEHRWLISFKLQKPTKKYPSGYKDVIMTTLELKTYLDSIENRSTYNIPKILNAKPLNLEPKILPIDPYVLGVWLGDGSKDCGIITQEKNSAIWLELKSRGYEFGPNLNHDPERSNVEMRTVYGLRTQLKNLNLINNKHIPEIYQLGSYEQRLDLLRGLMDTDGYYNKSRKRFVMNTSQYWQVSDLNKLLSTLGIKSTIFEVNNTCTGKSFPGWSLCFSTTKFNPFLVRNQNLNISKKDKNTFRNIESVELIETVPTQCIQVDSPSHTYLAGYSCIVTHNTNKKIETKGFFNTKTKTSTKMKFPLNNLDDVNFNHYQMQLSTYAWMLQKLHPEFVIKDLMIIHFDHEGNQTIYHCDYLKKEVEYMLAYHKKQLVIKNNRKNRERIEY